QALRAPVRTAAGARAPDLHGMRQGPGVREPGAAASAGNGGAQARLPAGALPSADLWPVRVLPGGGRGTEVGGPELSCPRRLTRSAYAISPSRYVYPSSPLM